MGVIDLAIVRRKMLGRRHRPEPVDALIRSEKVNQIVARRDHFDPERQKLVLPMGSPFHFLQHVLRTIGCPSQNQKQHARFTDCLSDLAGVRTAALDITGCDPAADILDFKCGADRIGYGLVLIRVGNKNGVWQFWGIRLSSAWTVSLDHVFAGSDWVGW